MSQQKCKASHSRIKQYFYSQPKQKFLAVSQQNVPTPAAVTAKIILNLLCRKHNIQLLESQKYRQFQLTVSHTHLTIRLFNYGLC